MRIKKILLIIITMTVVLSNIVSASAAPVKERPWDKYVAGNGVLRESAVASAETAILVDAKSGKILFGKNENSVMQPASITKIMTAILAIENCGMNDIVTINNQMAVEIMKLDDASMCGFQKKESIYVEDLLYGLMLLSGADASIALAIHIGGTYENFIKMMNDKAKELGMTKTVYKNPHGLYQSGHVTSASDMARLAVYANKFPAFAKIVSTGKHTPTDTDKNDYSAKNKVWWNSNKLVTGNRTYGYDYATGVKTGFTTPAGHTLVTSAEKETLSLVAVVLKDSANGKWINSITMFEYGFEYYDTIDLASLFSESELEIDVKNAASTTSGSQLTLQLAPIEKTYLTEKKAIADAVRENPEDYFTVSIEYYEDPIIAPIEKGEAIGTITYTYVNNHAARDYLDWAQYPGGIKPIEYKATLVAAETLGAAPAVTAELTEEPETTDDTEEDEPEETPLSTIEKIWIYSAIVVAILILVMFVSSYFARCNRYQQYSARKKTKEPKPIEEVKDNDDDDGNIKFEL